MISRQSPLKMGVGEQRSSYGTRSITAPLLLKRLYHYFRLWRNTTVWVHLYRGEREKPVIRLSSACSQAKLGLDLQAWIGGLLKGQPPTPGPKTLACGHAAP